MGIAQPPSTFYETIGNAFGRRNAPESDQHFWALRDVNFDVEPGQVVGIIGRNGAGKSTLLKILSRITAPTKGRVEIRGKLASLLEVGTGFHPELTGRENIFLNGSILGMTTSEVHRKLDAIVSFAELEKFIDTPVKRYSSGMYVRLAFAVAAHLDPDILIIDEVLAVGDADFQEKCVGKMEAIRGEGRTLLVVSHNMQLIKKLCPVAVLMERGSATAIGPIDDIQAKYLAGGAGVSSWSPAARDHHPFQFESVEVVPPQGHVATALPADRPFEILFRFEVATSITGRVALTIRNQFGVLVLASCDTDAFAYMNKRWAAGRYIERCVVPGSLLVPGEYWLAISRPLNEGNEIIQDICRFTIDRSGSLVERDYREGVVAPFLEWTTEERS